ncbi:putative DUF3835 domain-containing protein [Seiridium unicorne]|uniref:DUF3835 domain-containing protein n=1 Tax=Seiridium unicorne TaxID=138068 RepID=A0ABR2V1H1_9PEZI
MPRQKFELQSPVIQDINSFQNLVPSNTRLLPTDTSFMAPDDALEDLEQQRQRLEQNVAKTRALLHEWRQWKVEYESLKKGMSSPPSDAAPELIGRVRGQFKGKLVDEVELAKIFGEDNSQKRDQILSTLVNRLDYVGRNIATLEKQLKAAENGLATLGETEESGESDESEVPDDDSLLEDDGSLPVTEILEELDEDDNVVSYSLRTPGNNQPQLIEALEKAGLKDLPSPQRSTPEKGKQVKRPVDEAQSQQAAMISPGPRVDASKPSSKKKSVRFSEDTQKAEEQPKYMTLSASSIDELMREAKEQESIISDPVVPADESEDDAQLRRDMLQYNLSELNPVVAELTLEEGALTDDDEDDWDYDDDDDDEDDEDQWGRSKSSVLNDEYRQKMLEIQQRLQNHTLDSSTEHDDSDDDAARVSREGLAKIRVKTEEPVEPQLSSNIGNKGTSEPPSETKKSVRFASALDVADVPPPLPAATTPTSRPQRSEVDPLSEVIVERKSSATLPSVAPTTKKASRFKAARGQDHSSQSPAFKAPLSLDGSVITPEQPLSEQQFAPSGPEGQTVATSVLERAPADRPREPDEFDADMLKQQAAVEYHKVRNRMIQKQGGFMKEDESPIQPLDEEEGGPKRVSRFKAARLAKS